MIEPSDKEKSELPECTLNYLFDLEQENARFKKAILSYGKGKDFDWGILEKIDQLEEENDELRRVINELKENER